MRRACTVNWLPIALMAALVVTSCSASQQVEPKGGGLGGSAQAAGGSWDAAGGDGRVDGGGDGRVDAGVGRDGSVSSGGAGAAPGSTALADAGRTLGSGGGGGSGGSGSVAGRLDAGAAGKGGSGGQSIGSGGADGGKPTSPDGGSPKEAGSHDGFYVVGHDVFDRCGERFVIRGINKMVIYWDTQGRSFPEIAKTGANSVRIFWNSDPIASAQTLAQTLQAAVDQHLVPILANWDATGDWSKMQAVEDWWTRPDIVAVIKQYTPYMIANIANEAGKTVSDADWVNTYKRIVVHMRQVGIHALLAIDAAGYGRNVEQLLSLAPQVLSADPDHNIIFDWHEYDGGSAQNSRITASFDSSVSKGLALFVGEFANGGAGDCSPNIPYLWLMAEAERTGVGYAPWSWDNFNSDCQENGDSIFNMVTDPYNFSTLRAGWPTEVCVTDANSIKNTSRRTRWMSTGRCD